MYGFIILNNDLANAGYFITNENREEKYLEILETGDEKLISKLEDYLNYKDEIETVAHLERRFSSFRTEIRAAASVEEVTAIEERFLEKFYAGF
jgi:chromatin segregation and condensation protein Rec8/ScpA/Scc1 (kleisin family)